MPALIIGRRKWLLAGDDLIFPFLLETTGRALWLVATAVMLYLQFHNEKNCDEAQYVEWILFLLLMEFIVNTFLCAAIARVSSRGSIMEVEQRKILPNLLYVKLSLLIFEAVFSAVATWFIFSSLSWNPCINSHVKTFLVVTSIFSWFYFCYIIVITILIYDPLGPARFWNVNTTENTDTAEYFKKSERIWENRLKLFVCCLGVNKSTRSIFKDIATFLASFFKDVNLAPSDTLAGFIILSRKHAYEKRRLKFLDSLHNQGYATANDESNPSWMTVENALHFLRLAKSTYGWPMFFDTHNPCSLCVLMPRLRCFNSANIPGDDTCCSCNAAALQKVNGFTSDDLLYVSYHNNVCEPAFFIAIDRAKSSIVLCIRGTLSLSDIITDIDGGTEKVQFEQCPMKTYCHRGTYRSAYYIYRKLNELNILKSAFTEFPNYQLVVTGHSLGGSISSVLGLLLRSEYPNVHCYVYAPMAVLCADGIKQTHDFTFTIFVGDDMSPRLCARSFMDLQSDVTKCLQESKIQKYKLLLGVCTRFLFKKKIFRTKNGLGDPENFNDILRNDSTAIEQHSVRYCPSPERLYAPGRILFLEYTPNGVRSSWKTGCHFRRLLVTPRMMRDHQPHRIQKMLESVESQLSQEKRVSYFNRALSVADFFKETSIE